MGLHEKATAQRTLFDDPEEQSRSDKMMCVMDAINRSMGRDSVTIGAAGTKQRWATRREQKSPSYTSDWDELMEAW